MAKIIKYDDKINYVTPGGLQDLQVEYRDLKTKERPALVETIAWAASNGDRSENGDYIYGKRKLREIDKRIGYLGRQMDAAEVIDPTSFSGEQVQFGATVTLLDEDDKRKIYSIVGVDESAPERGYISWKSPIALALLNKSAGDYITVNTPKGERDFEIVGVEYKPL